MFNNIYTISLALSAFNTNKEIIIKGKCIITQIHIFNTTDLAVSQLYSAYNDEAWLTTAT